MSKCWKSGETSGEWGVGRRDKGTRRKKILLSLSPLLLVPLPPLLLVSLSLLPTPHSPFPTPSLPFSPFLPFLLPPWRRIAQCRRRSRGAKRRPPHRPSHRKLKLLAIARSG